MLTTRYFEMRDTKLVAAMLAALVISLVLVLGQGRVALAVTDYDGDGIITGDCQPLDPAVAPGKPDKPDLQFEDTNCDGIDGDKSKAVFVSRTTGNDAGTGTTDSPLQTIGAAISKASSDVNSPKDVYLTGGTYLPVNGGVTLVDNVDLYGGYTPSFGSRSESEVTLIQGAPQSVLADGDEGVVLQQLTLKGLKATNSSLDLSVYGVRAINNSKLALERVSVIAENGFDGSAGSTGFAPGRAADGSSGSDAPNCDTPGARVRNAGGSFASNSGGNGGAGGQETNNGEVGSAGERGLGGSLFNEGAGGTPSNQEPPPASAYGQPGTVGANGAQGANGSNANYTSASAGITWRTDRGTSGGQGGPGQGGGGGGGGAGHVGNFVFGFPTSWAAGGGGGGQGGTGGGGGTGGINGGGSFGVYLHNSSLAADASTTIQAGNGGNGGNGGQGGSGGQGGDGGQGGLARTDCGVTGLNGGAGGPGGQGGRGGDGGGGSGGPSAGVFAAGTTSSFARHNNSQAPAAGTAGVGGRIGGIGTQAESGEAAPMLPAGAAPSTTSDFDQDGIVDANDACVALSRGSQDANNDGCPDRPAKLSDTDGDTIPNNFDACPTVAANTVDGCPPDTTKPTISGMSPRHTSVIRDTTPTIKATVKDNRTNLRKANIKLYVAGKLISPTKYSYSAATDVLTYNSPKLALGKKTVKVVAADAARNVGNKSWYFTIK